MEDFAFQWIITCGKKPNLLTQPKLSWLLYNYLDCCTVKDHPILHSSALSVPLFWLLVACGTRGHGCSVPSQRLLFGLSQPAHKSPGSPLATAHTLVQYKEDIKCSLTRFPASSSPQGPPSIQTRLTVAWAAGKTLSFCCFPLSDTMLTWIIQLHRMLSYYRFQLQAWRGRVTLFIYVAGVQLQHAWEGSHGVSVCPSMPWRMREAGSAPARGPMPLFSPSLVS